MTANKHILIIGGGPAGTQAALAAAGPGRRVTLVSDGMPGGRATWQTLLPSKIWLGARRGDDFGALREQYEQISGAWQRQLLNQLELAGVELRLGTGSFLSPHEIQVLPPEGGYPDQLSADAIILATGSVPFMPPGMQPDGERIFAPHMVWKMTRLPERMVVIGAGGPATEYVDAFSRLGVRITWVTGPVGVLSAFPPDAGRFMAGVMERRGVRIITGMLARSITRSADGIEVTTADGAVYAGDMAFVAIGLRPDLERLNLPAAGLHPGSSGGLACDPYGRTSLEHIYLVGDAATPLSANISLAQGRVAGWQAAGLSPDPVNIEQAVMAIYTNPQVAMIGRTIHRSGQLQKVRVPFSASLRAHLLLNSAADGEDSTALEDPGFLEIIYDAQRRVMGALAICPEAAEVLAPLAVAIRAGMTIDALSEIYLAHPSFSELVVIAASQAR